MAGQISQIDLITDGSSPEFFVQVRFPSGETPSGQIEFYDSKNANTAQFDSAYTIDLSIAASLPSLSAGGFDYYNFPVTNGDLLDGNPQNFLIAVVDDGGSPTSVVTFGTNTDPGPVSLQGGSLDGSTIQSLITSGVVEGDAFQQGFGPFIIGTDNSVVTGQSDPNNAACFAFGTLISTPFGEVPVQSLSRGDVVSSADGRNIEVLWIGTYTTKRVFSGRSERHTAVRIKADSIGAGVPHTDLVVTADHAMVVDGFAVNAGVLANGVDIVIPHPNELPDEMVYYHIETSGHEVILANGAPAETFIDYVGRRVFDNYEEYVEIFGDDRSITEMSLPRISSRRQMPITLLEKFFGGPEIGAA
ncbi:hypothetical protein CDZ97_06605 [Mameliella alba]|uniref:Hint domain-containing protein n=1 Tax=Mameliella alba TaxID=561184 RepID=UPI000B52B63E|nr:Hint domain-containing protein [Mameliella alba]OWV65554.1 hypothetical protein CDZ97_06605 [Mameliella alba]